MSATFNPATDTDPEWVDGDAVCIDCGRARWRHRDGGMVYGLVCPEPDDNATDARARRTSEVPRADS